jgi:hypothetical protein
MIPDFDMADERLQDLRHSDKAEVLIEDVLYRYSHWRECRFTSWEVIPDPADSLASAGGMYELLMEIDAVRFYRMREPKSAA